MSDGMLGGGVIMLAHQKKTQDARHKTQDKERKLPLLSLESWILGLSIVFAVTLCFPSSAQEGGKIAVLYFTDHSKFDSGGCLSFWPLNVIFGTGQRREKWDLKSGFRDLLNGRLSEAGYNIMEPGHVDKALQEMGTEDPAALARKLRADVTIVGDIRKFQQHRARARSQGPTTLNSGPGTRMVAMGGVGGFYYSASVETNITIYDSSSNELESTEVNSKKDLRDFYMGIGPLTKSYHGGAARKESDESEQEPPIVDYKKLDTMKFGTDEFKNRTLFGIATMDVMDKIAGRVEEYLEPTVLHAVQGKIIYVGTGERLKENEVYIDLGAGDGIRPGHRLGVYIEGLQLTDPDTGEELGNLAEKKIGVIKVSKVEADHLSIAEIVEKTGQIERGNVVKRD
jgi:hypothetical protein